MRRAAQANWSRLPNHNPPRFYAAWTQSGHGDLSTQARVKAAYEFAAQPRLGNGRGALERWPRKQALTIGRGAGTEQ